MTAHPERISQRQLRNDSGAILRAVQAGERYIITNNGIDVAEIRPLEADPFAGLEVRRARPGANFRDLVPVVTHSTETGLEALLALRGER